MTFSLSLLKNTILILVKFSAQAIYLNSPQGALHFLAVIYCEIKRKVRICQLQPRMTPHLPLKPLPSVAGMISALIVVFVF